MKVYLVYETSEYDGDKHMGVFSSKEKATEYLKDKKPQWDDFTFEIDEFELDGLNGIIEDINLTDIAIGLSKLERKVNITLQEEFDIAREMFDTINLRLNIIEDRLEKQSGN